MRRARRAHIPGQRGRFPTGGTVSILDEFRLTGRVAIVTGASSGLGGGFAHALAQAGGSGVLAARPTGRLASVAAAVQADGGRAISVPLDVTDPDSCQAVAD